ncbi:phospholipase A2 inhibitor PIP-like [Sceloporus undulatus]|uniref:phospholipase A2 inhibitor PIP-like n=1 Tax=Sceloporus undulatus TaxID=8520 RepID=UPI001C4BF027|nr:phospholipase A2 inhibitor PIP-like [Sceloporus undulatus]
METLMGLFFWSMLLTTGSSLKCEVCKAVGNNCTGKIVECAAKENACGTMWVDVRRDEDTVSTISKGCMSKKICKFLRITIGIPYGRKTLKNIQCSMAPPSTASLPLALSGFLLKKILL